MRKFEVPLRWLKEKVSGGRPLSTENDGQCWMTSCLQSASATLERKVRRRLEPLIQDTSISGERCVSRKRTVARPRVNHGHESPGSMPSTWPAVRSPLESWGLPPHAPPARAPSPFVTACRNPACCFRTTPAYGTFTIALSLLRDLQFVAGPRCQPVVPAPTFGLCLVSQVRTGTRAIFAKSHSRTLFPTT